MLRYRIINALIYLTSAGVFLIPTEAYSFDRSAKAVPIQFKIPQHSVADALLIFAQQSGEQIIFRYDEAKDIPANELTGSYAALDALIEILKDTGLQAFRNPEGTIVIRKDPDFQAMKAPPKRTPEKNISTNNDLLENDLSDIISPVQTQKQVEELVITGSRIKRAELETPNLVSTIEAKTIKRTGTANIENLLNKLPQIVPSLTGNSNNPGEGIATVDLRGLGTSRTLVLVNGRRYVPSASSGIIDLNTIPTFLLDKIEIATGGTSAVYGADAIAGVVNFKLRDNFDGFEGLARYRISSHGDGEKYDLNLVYGTSFDEDRGSAFLHATVLKRHAVLQKDRDFSTYSLKDSYIKPNSANSRYGFGEYLSQEDGGVPGFIQLGSYIIPGGLVVGLTNNGPHPDLERFGANGEALDFNPLTDSFNYAPYNFLQIPQENQILTFGAKYKLSDKVEIYNQTIFSQNKVDLELAPTPLSIDNLEMTIENPFLHDSAKAALRGIDWYATGQIWQARDNEGALLFDEQGNPLQARQAVNIINNPDGSLSRTPLWNPDGTPVAAIGATTAENAGQLLYQADGKVQIPQLLRRMTEMGSRQIKNNRRTFSSVFGLQGDISANWTLQAHYNYNHFENTLNNINAVSLQKFRQAVDIVVENDEYVCKDITARQDGCVPANIFGEGNLSPQAITYLMINSEENMKYTRQDATAYINGIIDHGVDDGMTILAGIDWRKESSRYNGDPTNFLDPGNGFIKSDFATGSYNVWSLFSEVNLPLMKDIFAFKKFELSAALRYSQYSLSGAVWSAATGINWSPFSDLRLRGQYQRAVREPNISNLFSLEADSYPDIWDPCSIENIGFYGDIRDICEATGVPLDQVGVFEQITDQVRSIYKGNSELKVEKSDTFTIGFIYQPSYLPEFQLTLDYYNITLNNQISAFAGGAMGIIDSCYLQDINAALSCKRIHRNPDGSLKFIDASLKNMGKTATSGIDGQLFFQKQFDGGIFSDSDRLELVFQGSYLLNYDYQISDGLSKISCAGYYNGNCGIPLPHFRFTQSTTWQSDKWELSLRWRHYGGTRHIDAETTEVAVPKLPAKNYFDLYLQYRLSDDLIFRTGVDNIFNNKPDFVGTGQQQANSFPNIYDVLGSYFHFGLNFYY